MEWQLALLLIVGSLFFLMVLGIPVAFAFMIVNVAGVFLLWGGESGLMQLTSSIFESITTFSLLPLPLFILMGELMYHSGIVPEVLSALDMWIGRLPGRLGVVGVAAGTIFSTLTGDSLGGVALLGSTLEPEMRRRGYKKPMTLGPILAGGCLAAMIPPSGLAVILGAIGKISIGQILIAIVIPGLLMASVYLVYIVARCWLQPSLAPPYELPPVSFVFKIVSFARYVLPIGLVIFGVIGVMFLGIATPTEAAGTGALSMFVLIAIYRRLSWQAIKKAFTGTLEVTVMVLMIIVGALTFSQILAFSGGSRGLIELATGISVAPMFVMVIMQFVIIIMGTFMEPVAIMMVTLPLFMPIIRSLNFNPVWFAVLFLMNIEVADISPPFAMELFVLKGVASPDTTMGDIYRSALPFVLLDLLCMAVVMAFPSVALWLPSMMRG